MRIRTSAGPLFTFPGLLVFAVFLVLPGCARPKAGPDIFLGSGATWHERVAAAEIQRYVYLRTGVLPSIREARALSRIPDGALVVCEKGSPLVVGTKDARALAKLASLGPEDHWLKTLS